MNTLSLTPEHHCCTSRRRRNAFGRIGLTIATELAYQFCRALGHTRYMSFVRPTATVTSSAEPGQRGLGGTEAAHSMRSTTGWRRGRAQVHAVGSRRVRRRREAWSGDEVHEVVASAADVAAGIVRIRPFQFGRRRRTDRDDPVAEARSEACLLYTSDAADE